MRLRAASLVCAFALLSSFCRASEVLFYLPLASKSHKNVIAPLAREMAGRGHNVTVVTSDRDEVGFYVNVAEGAH